VAVRYGREGLQNDGFGRRDEKAGGRHTQAICKELGCVHWELRSECAGRDDQYSKVQRRKKKRMEWGKNAGNICPEPPGRGGLEIICWAGPK